jgi:hypothetical protein
MASVRFTDVQARPTEFLDFTSRSYWIPGSWHLRMVYTDDISCRDPSQESNRAGQH